MRLASLLLLVPSLALAQPLDWSFRGSPPAGRPLLHPQPDGSVVAVHRPNTFPTGFYFSPDGGMTWTPSADSHSGPDIPYDIVRTSSGLLVGAGRDSLLHSRDGGRSWAVVGPYDGGSLDPIVAIGDRLLRASGGVISRSLDDGRTWLYSGTLPIPCCADLAYAPDGTVWAASDGGTAMSPDAGATWVEANAGLPVADRDVQVLAVGRERVFALTARTLYVRSTAAGTNWQPLRTSSGDALDVGVSADGAVIIMAEGGGRVVVSRDQGLTWTTHQVGRANAYSTIHEVAVTSTGSLLAAEWDVGVWATESDGAGSSWDLRGLPACTVISTATLLDSQSQWLWAACERYGVAESSDGGRTWTALGYTDLSYRRVLGVTQRGTVFDNARRYDPVTKTWGIALPSNPTSFGSLPDGTFYAFFEHSWARTNDEGVTWANGTLPPDFYALTVLPSGRFIGVSSVDGRAFYSDDEGATWTHAPGLVGANYASSRLTALSERGTLYTTSWMGLFRSTDSGEHWTRLRLPGLPHETPDAIATGPDGDVAYAYRNTVYLSRDDGETWFSVGEVVPRGNWPYLGVTALHITQDRRILAGIETRGFYSAAYSPTTGTEPLPGRATAWRVWPNPASGVLRACCTDTEVTATLYDLLGRRVLTAAVARGEVRMEVGALPSGPYLLRVADHVELVTIGRD